jgi:AcrR family transcriptional regulator
VTFRAPPSRPALRARYEERQRAIIRTAARVFAERGYRQTSIDDLVAATGLQRGGLYHYITSKQHLLLMIHDELMNPLLERGEQILRLPGAPAEHLRALVRVWVEHVAGHRDHMTVFNEERRLIESHADWIRVRQLRRSFQDLLDSVLQRGVACGDFAIQDVEVTQRLLLGTVNHLSSWFDPSGRLSPAELADRCVELILYGIAQPAARG